MLEMLMKADAKTRSSNLIHKKEAVTSKYKKLLDQTSVNKIQPKTESFI